MEGGEVAGGEAPGRYRLGGTPSGSRSPVIREGSAGPPPPPPLVSSQDRSLRRAEERGASKRLVGPAEMYLIGWLAKAIFLRIASVITVRHSAIFWRLQTSLTGNLSVATNRPKHTAPTLPPAVFFAEIWMYAPLQYFEIPLYRPAKSIAYQPLTQPAAVLK